MPYLRLYLCCPLAKLSNAIAMLSIGTKLNGNNIFRGYLVFAILHGANFVRTIFPGYFVQAIYCRVTRVFTGRICLAKLQE